MRSWVLAAVLMVVVAVAVSAAHWPALSAQVLTLDDGQFLTDNHLVRNPSWSAAWQFLTEVFEPSTVRGYYQPLSMISLMLDSAMGGRVDDLYVFHRTSLALHVLNTMLVIALLYALFGQPWPAALAGLLFGVHPITVEPIPWVGERKTLLAAFFALLCLLAYVRYTHRVGWKSYVTCMVLYVLALMSKPTSTPIPLVLLLLDFWPLRRLSRASVVEKIPFLLIAVVAGVVTVVSQRHFELVQFHILTAGQTLLLMCHNLIFYPTKMIWPTNLSSLYPFPANISLSDALLLTSTMTCIALAVFLLISLRWTRALLVGWLCYVLLLAPTLLNKSYSPSVAWDKYAYLPSIGLVIILGWLFGRCWGALSTGPRLRLRRVGLTAMVLILVGAEGIATRNQLTRWRDTETWFRYMLSLTPQEDRLHNYLGYTLAEQGKTEEAIQHFREALRLRPGFARAHNNLGRALAQQGKTDEAIQQYKQALQHHPNFAEVHNNLGMALSERGKNDEAIRHYRQALRLKPEFPKAYNNLGAAVATEGKTAEALKCYKQALQLKPDFAAAHSNMGNAYVRQGQLDKAIQHYEQALRLQPDLPDALNNLAWALSTHDIANAPDPAYAVELAERACQRNEGKKPDYLDTLAACYAAANRFPDAVATAKRAIELATSSGQAGLAEGIRARLRLYETGQPYRERAEPVARDGAKR